MESQRAEVSLSANEENDDERSYVLLIYEDVNATATKDCVSLNNLLVALLAHQMLLQTIGTILLQGTQHLIPSLAGVVSNMSENRILDNLPEEAVDKLLNCLELSYNTAVEFDSRPGLKFLLQKVAQLDRAANLYRQAGAAWTINLIALFDLCIHDQQHHGNGDNCIREFMPKLRQSLEQLCDTYIDVLLDKDGIHSAVDRFDEKITFIIAQTDDLTDLISNTSANCSTNCSGKCEEETGCSDDNREESNEEEGERDETEGSEKSETDKGDLAAEIEKQKCESICKDREAHMGVWAEMLVSAMELLCQLDDIHLKALLPAVFPTLRSLTAYATHSSLKHQLARVFDKLANIYGFAASY